MSVIEKLRERFNLNLGRAATLMGNGPTLDEAAEERAAATLFFADPADGNPPPSMDYLLLLHAEVPELVEALARMRAALAIASPTDVEQDVTHLLRAVNWRSHNIACLALLSRPPSPNLLHELWSAIEKGSWTSPQLAATAALVDSQFDQKARSLVASRSTYYKSIVSLAALLQRDGRAVELPSTSQANVRAALRLDLDGSMELALGRFHALGTAASAT